MFDCAQERPETERDPNAAREGSEKYSSIKGEHAPRPVL